MQHILGTCSIPVLPDHGNIQLVTPAHETDNQTTYTDDTVFIFGCDEGYDHPDRTVW